MGPSQLEQRKRYFFAAGLDGFLEATFGISFGAATAGAADAALRAARWSLSALISTEILFLRSVSLAMLALSFAMALAVLEMGAFLPGLAAGLDATFAEGFIAFGAAGLTGFFAALGATFFAVAISISYFC